LTPATNFRGTLKLSGKAGKAAFRHSKFKEAERRSLKTIGGGQGMLPPACNYRKFETLTKRLEYIVTILLIKEKGIL
jgi:hypothetical protein